MGKCSISTSSILPQEVLTSIEKSREGLYIKGLTSVEQRQVVKTIANTIVAEGEGFTAQNVMGKLQEGITSRRKSNNTLIGRIQGNKLKERTQATQLAGAIYSNELMDIIEDNLPILFKKGKEELRKIKEIKVIPEDMENDDDLNNDELASEVAKERTDFSDNFSIMYDAKANAPGVLKVFMSFLTRSTFNVNGGTSPVKTFFGAEEFLDFGEAYDDLHAILEGVHPDADHMIAKLESAAKTAAEEGNHALAWLPDLIDKLKEENKKEDSSVLNLFIRDMGKHRIKMEYIHYVETRDNFDNYSSRLIVSNDNSMTSYTRALHSWISGHHASLIVDTATGTYRESSIEKLKNKFAETRKGTGKEKEFKAGIAVRAYFQMMGIPVPPAFINAITSKDVVIYNGRSKVKSILKLAQLLERTLTKLTDETDKGAKIDPSILDTNLIKGIAREAVKYTKRDSSNVMRVGDKLLHVYTANHAFSDKVRDLKEDVFPEFDNTIFTRGSIYGKMLRDKDPDFIEAFGMTYASLYPLSTKVGSKRTNKGTAELAAIDLEIMEVGFAFQNTDIEMQYKSFVLADGSVVTVQAQPGGYIAPTMSDKTRAMVFNGYTFRVAREVGETGEDVAPQDYLRSEIAPDALALFVDSVVVPEIDRIVMSKSKDYTDSLNLNSYEGGLFYLTPYLNEIHLDKTTLEEVPESENSVPLLTLIKEGKYNTADAGPKLKDIITKAVKQDLETKAADRKQTWSDLGLVKDGIFTKNTSLKGALIDGNDNDLVLKGKAYATDMALDMTFSEEMSRANFFQLIDSDPAQSYIAPKVEGETHDEKVRSKVNSTASNITKRLASMIAPGEAADTSKNRTHIQIFLEDVVGRSKNIRDRIRTLDGVEKLKEYDEIVKNSMDLEADLKEFSTNLNSRAYFFVEGTDAQEYATWRGHIKEMLRYGELNKAEHDEIVSTIENNRPLSEMLLQKVLGPRKPVYAQSDAVATAGKGMYMMRKTYIKSSIFPLLPQLTQGMELDSLRVSMEKIEKDNTGTPVRAAYHSAVKQGFPKRGVKLLNNNGTFKKKITITEGKNALTLKSSGIRIQNSIPYSADKNITGVGSQEKKSLFAGHLDALFEYDGEEGIPGRKLKETYDNLYRELSEEGYRKYQEFLKNAQGNVDNKKLSYLLKKELKARGEKLPPMYEALAIDPNTGDFVMPLWQSDYADNFMALMNSIVKKYTLDKKIKGTSSVLASEEGMVAWEEGGAEIINNAEGVVYAPKSSYDQKIGLQGQRVDPKTGEILPAQIMLPFKERDEDGNLLDIRDFVLPGTNIIDVEKLPDNVRKAFSFRIPTQLHQSMAFVEIVAFLPQKLGDLVIATKDFTVLMGSDFDVDKLYSYLYATEYKDGKLTRLKDYSKKSRDNDKAKLDLEINNLYADLQGVSEDTKEAIELATKESIAIYKKEHRTAFNRTNRKDPEQLAKLKKRIATERTRIRKELLESFGEVKKGLSDTILNKITELEAEKDRLDTRYTNSINNKIIDIHAAVMLNKTIQKSLMAPLSSKDYEARAARIERLRGGDKHSHSIISNKYNKKKLMDGNAGRIGIAIFSVDSIFQSYLEAGKGTDGKGIVVREKIMDDDGNTKKVPIRVEFGNGYAVSRGEVGRVVTLKENSSKTVGSMITALQNLSVDNAVLEAMAKINLNATTANVYTFLHYLGFEDDIVASFMSQPILFDYVERLANMGAFHSEFTPDGRDGVVSDLIKKYAPDFTSEDNALANFKGEDAVAIMEAMIEDTDKVVNFGKTQIAILNKFLTLSSYMQDLSIGKKYVNLDSKGFNKNMFVTTELIDKVGILKGGNVENLDRILGTLTWNEGTVNYDLEVNTLAGFDYEYGAKPIKEDFAGYFIEGDKSLLFSDIVNGASDSIGRPLRDTELYELRNHYKNYLNSNLVIPNVGKLRHGLFYNIGEGSLFKTLRALKLSEYGKKNKFISSLNVKGNQDTELVTINYEKVAGDSFDEEEVYEAFVDALLNSGPIEVGDGETVNPSEIMQQLSVYGILKGGRAGVSFTKFIPPAVKNAIIDKVGGISTSDFLRQFFTNRPSFLPALDKKKYTSTDPETGLVTLKGFDRVPMAIRLGKKLYIHTGSEDPVYSLVASKENIDIYDYSYKPKPVNGANTGATNNTVAQDILAEEELDLSNIYTFFNNSTAITGESKMLFDALSKSESNVPVLILDPEVLDEKGNPQIEDKVEGEYRIIDGVETIVLNKNLITTQSDSAILSVIMHEHMHKMSETTIKQMSTGAIPKSAAFVRIQNNMASMVGKLTTTDGKLDSVKVKKFKSYIYYIYGDQSKEELRELKDNSLNIETKKILSQLILAKNTEGFYEKAIANGEILASEEILEDGEEQLEQVMHVASSIYEYVAIAPGDLSVFEDYLGEEYKSFVDSILDFLMDVLAAFGIKDIGLQKALSDIYSIANIEYTNEFSSSEDNISIIRGGAMFYINNDKYSSYGGTTNIIKQDANQFVAYTEGFVVEYISAYTKDEGSRLTTKKVASIAVDSSATLIDNIRALASAQIVDPKSDVSTILRNKLGIKRSTEMSPIIPKTVPVKVQASNADIAVAKAAKKATLFGKKPGSTSLEFRALKKAGKAIDKLCNTGGNIKAEKGLASGKVAGKGWKILKELSGPTHAEGGISLSFKNGMSSINMGDSTIKAEDGLLLEGEVHPIRSKVTGSGWSILKELEGPTHADGGIDLTFDGGMPKLTRGKTTIKAEDGLLLEGDGTDTDPPEGGITAEPSSRRRVTADPTKRRNSKKVVVPETVYETDDVMVASDTNTEEAISIEEEPVAVKEVYKKYKQNNYVTPNMREESRVNTVEGIVFHHTGDGDYESVHNTFMNPDSKASAHVVINADGTRSSYAKPSRVLYHAGVSNWRGKEDANNRTIGIELFGNTNNNPLTEDQISSTLDYLTPIIKEYGIAEEDFTTHAKIAYDKEMYRSTGNREYTRKTDITQIEFDRMMEAVRKRFYTKETNEYNLGGDLNEDKSTIIKSKIDTLRENIKAYTPTAEQQKAKEDAHIKQRDYNLTVNTIGTQEWAEKASGKAESFTVADMLPGTGEIADAAYTIKDLVDKNYTAAGVSAAAILVPGLSAGALKRVTPKIKVDKIDNAIKGFIDKSTEEAKLLKIKNKVKAGENLTIKEKFIIGKEASIESFAAAAHKDREVVSKFAKESREYWEKKDQLHFLKKKLQEEGITADIPKQFEGKLGYATWLEKKGLLKDAVDNPDKYINDEKLVGEFVENYTNMNRGVVINKNLTGKEKEAVLEEMMSIGGTGRLGDGSYHSNSQGTLETFSTSMDANTVGIQAQTKLNLPGMEKASAAEKLDIISNYFSVDNDKDFQRAMLEVHGDIKKYLDNSPDFRAGKIAEGNYGDLQFAERRIGKELAENNSSIVSIKSYIKNKKIDSDIGTKYGYKGLKDFKSDTEQWFNYNANIVEELKKLSPKLNKDNRKLIEELDVLQREMIESELVHRQGHKAAVKTSEATQELNKELMRISRKFEVKLNKLKRQVTVGATVVGIGATAVVGEKMLPESKSKITASFSNINSSLSFEDKSAIFKQNKKLFKGKTSKEIEKLLPSIINKYKK